MKHEITLGILLASTIGLCFVTPFAAFALPFIVAAVAQDSYLKHQKAEHKSASQYELTVAVNELHIQLEQRERAFAELLSRIQACEMASNVQRFPRVK